MMTCRKIHQLVHQLTIALAAAGGLRRTRARVVVRAEHGRLAADRTETEHEDAEARERGRVNDHGAAVSHVLVWLQTPCRLTLRSASSSSQAGGLAQCSPNTRDHAGPAAAV